MLMSMITALISGTLMSIQGVFNTRVSSKAGLWFTSSLVHLTAFIVCLCVLFFVRDTNLTGLKSVNKFYLLGGVLGAGITYTVIVAVGKLGPAYAVMLILIAQMCFAYAIELMGWFDTPKAPWMWSKGVGVALMIAGIIAFQWRK